jgi:hypothetical protein
MINRYIKELTENLYFRKIYENPIKRNDIINFIRNVNPHIYPLNIKLFDFCLYVKYKVKNQSIDNNEFHTQGNHLLSLDFILANCENKLN